MYKDRYEYNGYYIVDNHSTGSWDVVDLESGDALALGFSTSSDAEYYIDNLDTNDIFIDMDEDTELPIKRSTTRKMIEKKYNNVCCEAYVLKSAQYKGVYAVRYNSTNGLGSFDDPGLLVYKSEEIAYDASNRTKSKYYVMKVIIENGSIRFYKKGY